MLPVKVQIKFAKALLGVNKQAVNLAVLGELGMTLCIQYLFTLLNQRLNSGSTYLKGHYLPKS